MTHGEKAAAIIFLMVGIFLGGLWGLTYGAKLTLNEIQIEGK